MSLGLRLLAKSSVPFPARETVADELARWIRETYSHLLPKVRVGETNESPTVFCQLHPGAEEFELTLSDSLNLVASANTTTAGPGYHIFLTALLKDCASKFSLTWQVRDDSDDEYGDETGFFFSGDEQRLRDEMSDWLKALAGLFFDGSIGPEDEPIALGMPVNPQFSAVQPAITQMGPRDRDWLLQTSQDGKNGIGFFAWWDSGFGAGYYLGRALSQMWSDVRWRKPISDNERDVLRDVAHSLSSAYQLDPSLRYPWAEWLEILNLLESGEEEKGWLIPKAADISMIGYRRDDVRVTLPGRRTVRVPGSFSDFEPDENGAFFAMDPPRELWFTAYQSQAPLSPSAWEEKKQEIRADDPEFLIDQGSSIAHARISEGASNAGGEYFVIQSSVLCPDKRCVCTIVFSEENQRDWALDTWKSLTPPSRD